MNQLIEQVVKEKLIVIIRNVATEDLLPLAQALYDNGIRLLEVTYDASGKVPDETTAANIKLLAEHFAGKLSVGAGTVLTKEQVELTHKAGGRFIISPDVNAEVITCSKALGLVSMPGALTPSEVTAAHRAGADFIKLFPASVMGCSYIRAIKAPLSHVKMLAVGGVDLDNLTQYLSAGICGFGIGSNLVDKKLIAKKDYKTIGENAGAYVRCIRDWEASL